MGILQERSTVSRIKGIYGVPTVICNVHHVRNTGLPTGCESYGNGVLVVVVGVTPHQGNGNADYRAKGDR